MAGLKVELRLKSRLKNWLFSSGRGKFPILSVLKMNKEQDVFTKI
ncbi:hypothetical protein [Halothermothrix orenii]|nr:hypothetical protein [Halothermothrix orenii]